MGSHDRWGLQSVVPAGPALALMPLVVAQQHIGIPAAVTCLTAAVGLQAFCYAGFHAYIQVGSRCLEQSLAPLCLGRFPHCTVDGISRDLPCMHAAMHKDCADRHL